MTRRGRDVWDDDDDDGYGDPCEDVLEDGVIEIVNTSHPIAWLRSGDSSSVMTHELVFVFPLVVIVFRFVSLGRESSSPSLF